MSLLSKLIILINIEYHLWCDTNSVEDETRESLARSRQLTSKVWQQKKFDPNNPTSYEQYWYDLNP